MEFAVGVRSKWPIKGCVLIAKEAERLGYHQVYTNNTPLSTDPFIVLNEIAKETKKIALGTAIVNPYERHPITLASSALTLVEATRRKFTLGISCSWREWLEQYGIDARRPLSTVRQAVVTVKKIFLERVPTPEMSPNVVVGAQGPKMLQMSGEVADGIVSPKSLKRYDAFVMKNFLDGLNRSERPKRETRKVILASILVTSDDKEGIKRIRPVIAEAIWHFSTPALEQLNLTRADADAIHSNPNLPSDEFVREFAIMGDPKECRRQVKEVETSGADQLYLWYATDPSRVKVEDQIGGALELIKKAAEVLF